MRESVSQRVSQSRSQSVSQSAEGSLTRLLCHTYSVLLRACVMLSLTVPYKAGHHTLGRVCVGEGLGSEEGYFMGRTGGGRGGKGARWARVAVQGGRHAVRNQASMIPPPTRKELLRPSSRVCCTCYRNMVEHTRATQHAKITI